jgi:hypothetical protein
MAEENILELVSQVDEFFSMHEEFKDANLDFALSKIVKIIMKPDIPPQALVTLIIQLEAIAAKLHIVASYYKNVSKPKPDTVEYKKKNMYFSVAEAISSLVAALKYGVRGVS